jgi:spermidine/putrescine transport system permease protein
MRVLRSYATLVFLFLYAPIAVIVVFSFSAGHSASDFHGFSLQWYATAAGDRFVKDALVHSLIIAAASSALATVVGTAAALVLPRIRGPFRVVFDALTYVAIMVPGIVIGIATLIALVTAFEVLNPTLAALWPGDPAASPQLHMGLGSVILAHSVFATALVIMLVRARLLGMDRSLLEASSDLYATPWGTFRQVTLPLILPAVIAGFLLSFTFSLDDYVVASFVAGPTVTLPIYIFASVRRGVTPEINAIGTVVLSVSLLLLFGSLLLLRRGQRAGAATSKA